MTEQPVAVVGAGLMGHAIALVFASAGHAVAVFDPDEDVRESVVSRIAAICERRDQSRDVVRNIKVYSEMSAAISDAGFVIEAAPESRKLKQALFARLGELTDSSVVLATNTSVIPVTEIGSETRAPERVVGTHFWNPPYAVRLVEVVEAPFTSDETVRRTMNLLDGAGQKPVHVKKDIPGFIGNRLQHALKREAIALVENGVCDAETIDAVIRHSFGARLGIMGTLEQSDLVGLDLTLAIHEVLLPHLDNSSEPQTLLRDLVEAGHVGVRTGRGFRSWSREEAEELRLRLDRALPR